MIANKYIGKKSYRVKIQERNACQVTVKLNNGDMGYLNVIVTLEGMSDLISKSD